MSERHASARDQSRNGQGTTALALSGLWLSIYAYHATWKTLVAEITGRVSLLSRCLHEHLGEDVRRPCELCAAMDPALCHGTQWQIIGRMYAAVIPSERLVMSKAHTGEIERNHGRQHHGFGRFKRRAIIVSKSKDMVDLASALFAWVRVNRDVAEMFASMCLHKPCSPERS